VFPTTFLRRIACGVLVAGLCAGSALAQQVPIKDSSETAAIPAPDSVKAPIPLWRNSVFPLIGGQPNDGPAFGVVGQRRMTTPVDDIVTSRAELQLNGGFTLKGGYFGYLTFYAPRLLKRWRFNGVFSAVRQVRYGYLGLGNDTPYDPDLVTDEDPFLYRMQREQVLLSGEVTRRFGRHVGIALQVAGTRDRFRALDGASLFRNDFGDEITETDYWARFALVYDTRDLEWDTRRGVLLEGGMQYGLFREDYQRAYVILRGYQPLGPRTVLAGRAMGAVLSGTPTLNARFSVPGWERNVFVLGGEDSHRGLVNGRFLGNDVLLTNAEIRHWLWTWRPGFEVGAIGWVDAGRVFEGEGFELTLRDWKVGAGAGLAFRVRRTNIFTVSLGAGGEGANLTFKSGWMF
jgi:hypothetical protein